MAPLAIFQSTGLTLLVTTRTSTWPAAGAVKGLLLAKRLIGATVTSGKDVCFVGTKRQAKAVLEARVKDVKQHYVTERWLGGTLTNFRTIRSRLKRLEVLEAIEAKGGSDAKYSKKMESQLRREKRRILRNLEIVRPDIDALFAHGLDFAREMPGVDDDAVADHR